MDAVGSLIDFATLERSVPMQQVEFVDKDIDYAHQIGIADVV